MFASIVIPARNEERSLEQLAGELDAALAGLGSEVEVIFVDDASTDGTPKVLDAVRASHPWARVLTMDRRGGQSGCFQAAFAEARGRYILRMDADLQDDPADLPRFFPYLEEGYDLVIGLRSLRRHRRLLRLASMAYDASAVLLFDSPLHIHATSFLAVRADLVKGIRFRRNDHRHIPLIALERGASRIAEIVVRNRDRKFGHSKYSNWQKLVAGVPEVVAFFVRLKLGRYGRPGDLRG